MPELTTYTVGESWCRRVVVCPSELRAESEEDSDAESSGGPSEGPPGSSAATEPDVKAKPSSRAPKRPDQPLYMPRAARKRVSLQNPRGSPADEDPSSPAQCSSISAGRPADPRSCPKATHRTDDSASSAQEPCGADGVAGELDGDSELCPQERTGHSAPGLHGGDALAWDQARASFAELKLEEAQGEDFNGVQTEDTSTDADDVTELIMMHLKETDVSVELVHNDFSIYENVFLNSDDFSHVIEIYDFPAVLKTDDLLDAFTEYSDGGMKIKWVDNTHALGVFSSEAAALHALSICHPLLKTRALCEGSKKAQGKAVRRAEFLQPVRERPRTDSAVAKRMVTRALGIQGRGRLHRY